MHAPKQRRARAPGPHDGVLVLAVAPFSFHGERVARGRTMRVTSDEAAELIRQRKVEPAVNRGRYGRRDMQVEDR